MEVFAEIISAGLLLAILILEIRRPSAVIPMEEKIANTKRILTNLVPITLLLVTDAENTFGGNTGAIKRAYVIDELYKRVPDDYKQNVTEENLSIIVEKTLEKAVIFWQENPHIMVQH